MRQCKAKKCKECQEYFQPVNSLQNVCGWPCALERVNRINNKKATVALKKEESLRKSDLRARKEALKSKSKWLAEAQAVFNKFIRLRDANEPCISCGRFVHDNDLITGSRWDCGHYLTRGAFPELRFVEQNCAKQCSSCNGGSDKYTKKAHTVTQQYTENLVKKIGIVQFEWLKAKHEAKKYTIDDIKEIKAEYQAKVKQLSAISAGE